MAEIFGTVAGALSVAALFSSCVSCFEYIQLGRQFRSDFGRCQLKLDIAAVRLARWGQAVAINEDPRFATTPTVDKDAQQAFAILEEIAALFATLQKKSKRYELGAKHGDLVVLGNEDMPPVAQRLHGRFEAIALQRQKQTSLIMKATWALYDGKSFDKLVGEIKGFIEDLENLYPVEAACRQLARMEVEEVDDEPSLLALQDAAANVDDVLSETIEEKVQGITGWNYAKEIKVKENARVRVGNEWSESVLARGTAVSDRTRNRAEFVAARGKSVVHIGNSYSGRSIFD